MTTKLKLLQRSLKGLRGMYPLLQNDEAKKRMVKETNRIKAEIAALEGKQHSDTLYEEAKKIFSS